MNFFSNICIFLGQPKKISKLPDFFGASWKIFSQVFLSIRIFQAPSRKEKKSTYIICPKQSDRIKIPKLLNFFETSWISEILQNEIIFSAAWEKKIHKFPPSCPNILHSFENPSIWTVFQCRVKLNPIILIILCISLVWTSQGLVYSLYLSHFNRPIKRGLNRIKASLLTVCVNLA